MVYANVKVNWELAARNAVPVFRTVTVPAATAIFRFRWVPGRCRGPFRTIPANKKQSTLPKQNEQQQ